MESFRSQSEGYSRLQPATTQKGVHFTMHSRQPTVQVPGTKQNITKSKSNVTSNGISSTSLLPCGQCPAYFTDLRFLEAHILVAHKKECYQQGERYLCSEQFLIRIDLQKVRVGSFNDDTSKSQENVQKQPIFKCSECCQTFDKLKFLWGHKKLVHARKAYNCVQCGKGIPTPWGLARHTKTCPYETNSREQRKSRNNDYPSPTSSKPLIQSKSHYPNHQDVKILQDARNKSSELPINSTASLISPTPLIKNASPSMQKDDMGMKSSSKPSKRYKSGRYNSLNPSTHKTRSPQPLVSSWKPSRRQLAVPTKAKWKVHQQGSISKNVAQNFDTSFFLHMNRYDPNMVNEV